MKKTEILKGLSEMIEVSRLKSNLTDYAVLVAARDIVEKSSVDDEWKERLVKLGLFGSVKAVDKAIKEGLIQVDTKIEIEDEPEEEVCCKNCEYPIDDDLDGSILITPDMEAIEVASMLATMSDFQIPFDLPHKRFTTKELKEIADYLLIYAHENEENEE